MLLNCNDNFKTQVLLGARQETTYGRSPMAVLRTLQ
jgi:hypothetical protein